MPPTLDICALTQDAFVDIRACRLRICACRPAPEQLLALGFFPCAPRRPTVAFSLRLLEFLSLHDLHVAPNVRAWASTLQMFWTRRGHMSNEKVRCSLDRQIVLSCGVQLDFRKRLGNALRWYEVLVNRKDAAVVEAIKGAWNVQRRSASDDSRGPDSQEAQSRRG